MCFANTRRHLRTDVWVAQPPARLPAVVPDSAVRAAVWDLGTWDLFGTFTAFLDDLYFCATVNSNSEDSRAKLGNASVPLSTSESARSNSEC